MTTSRPRAHERSQLLAIAIFTFMPLALLAVWARFWSPAPIDQELVDGLAAGPDLIGQVSGAINVIGNVPNWALIVVISAAALGLLSGARAAILVVLSLVSDVAAFVVKALVERQRPETAATEQFFGMDDFSFPSGHTVRAAAFAAVVLWLIAPKKWRVQLAVIGGVVAGAVMGYARVSLGVHWPTDTIGGTLLGLGWFALTTAAVWFGLQRPQEPDGSKG
jgi:membrane-associated phospholipid phosphatase